MRAHLYGISNSINDVAPLSSNDLLRKANGNVGNLLSLHSLSRMLDTTGPSIPWRGDVGSLSASSDRLVLPLTDHLGASSDLGPMAERFRELTIPVVAIGLGCQGPIAGFESESIPAGSWNWLEALASVAASDRPNIALRGATTFDVVSTHGYGDRCIVTGCPSNMINPSYSLGREIYRRRADGFKRIAVTAGNPHLPHFRRLEQSLVRLMGPENGSYICQHPSDMIRLSLQEHTLIGRKTFQTFRNYIHPDLDDDSFLGWFRDRSHTFEEPSSWMSFLRRHDLVVGTRIQGVMAGIQAGVPGLCLCTDLRTLELCETMKIPHVNAFNHLSGISIDQIYDTLRAWDHQAYDEMRYNLARKFSDLFRWNGLEYQGSIKSILRGSAQSANVRIAKSNDSESHQLSTSSLDHRYPAVFSSLRKSVEKIAPKIMSFGCSDGFETLDLATKYFHHAEVLGFDIDEEALRIARSSNRYPFRVRILASSEVAIQANGPYDVVTAMAVFCRWPEASKVTNLTNLYPFYKFEESIQKLFSLLAPGGVLCVYNANYHVTDCTLPEHIETIESSDLPSTQTVRLFHRDGTPDVSERVRGILFRRTQ